MRKDKKRRFKKKKKKWSKKLTFIKKQEASGLLSSTGIKTPLS